MEPSPLSLTTAGDRPLPEPDEPGAAAVAAVAADESEEVFVFPATPAQRRLWLMDQLVPGGNPALNMPCAARLTGRLDLGALRRGFNEIVRRHEVLRTTFHCEKGQLRQLISPELILPVPLIDVNDYPAAERPDVLEHLMVEEGGRPFDLSRGPVVRASLVRVRPEDHVLLITIHHVVSDGWSNGVLLRELGLLYAAFVQNRPSPLPDLPLQFADFAQWQHEQAAADGTDGQMTYWREKLAGELPVLDLPADRPRRLPRGRAALGGIRRDLIPSALAGALRTLATGEGVSVFMLYLAVFTVLLRRYSGGQEDVLLNTPSANRDRREVEPLIGLFLNPLLLRVDLSGNPTFRELLARVRQTVLGAFEHGGACFEKLVEELQPRRLQVNFQYQNGFLQPMHLPSLELVPIDTRSGVSNAEWSAAVVESGEQTRFSIEYNADLFDAGTIDRVVAGYRRLLEAVAAPGRLDQPISRLPVEAAPVENGPWVLLAERWRLPAESVRWMDGCFETGGNAGAGELGCSRPGVEVWVLDPDMERSPVGVVGEIYVGGLDEGAGPASSGSAWLTHPERGRLLKTGDLARCTGDHRLRWMGRAEQAGRVDGLRVDAGLIEAALQAHPHIEKAVVRWRETDGGGPRRLVAFFEGDGAPLALVSPGQLKDFLRESLPEELVPAAFVPTERLPLTTDGRLDAAALPEPAPLSGQDDERYESPYLTVHYQLIEIWRELLRVPRIGIRDDFFELGGNSLLALRMLYQVEQACGTALLPSTLFQRATVEHLADALLRRSDAEVASDVIKICETGAKTPIFYLHGDMTGGGYYCMKLSRRLGPDQPFYALPPLTADAVRSHPTLESMASAHLQTMRAVRPRGPYVIGGFCVGGLIAQAMATQLESQGEAVERLLIIDATSRDRRLEHFQRLAKRLGRWRGWDARRQLNAFSRWHFLVARLERWMGLDRQQQKTIFRRRLGNFWGRVRQRLRLPTAETAMPTPTMAGTWFDPRWDVPLLYLWAVAGFRPRPYGGRTTLLLSHDLVGHARHPEHEWRKLIPRLESRELVGSHLACITEHVDGLAETVRACLAESTP